MRISDWSSDVCSSDLVAWADADLGRHGAVVRDLHLLLSGGDLNGAEKAGRIAGGEELLWIVALAARPAELLRGGKLDGEGTIGGFGGARATAGSGSFGPVENFHDLAPSYVCGHLSVGHLGPRQHRLAMSIIYRVRYNRTRGSEILL